MFSDLATKERHQSTVGTAGRNQLLPDVSHLGPDLRACLYKQRIRQQSREFDTMKLVSVDKEDICLPQKTCGLAGETSEHYRLSGWLKPQGIK